jgi:DNA (cytosine-5)-methyltransferase 1
VSASAPVAFDLYAGAGGLSLGLTEAGFSVRAAVDRFPEAVATYEKNLGCHVLEAGVEEISPRHLLSLAGCRARDVALMAGGPPCQGFSVQRRGPDEDPRNSLILRFLDFVAAIKPAFFLLENVVGLRGRRGKPTLLAFVDRADRLGYRLHTGVLNAADYGVPQIRRRLILVGERNGRSGRPFKFPAPTRPPDRWLTVQDAIGDLPSPIREAGAGMLIPNHEPDRISDLNRLRISFVPPGGGRQDIPEHLRLPCHGVDVEVAGHRGVYGRLAWDRPAGTITTRCNSFTRGRFAHPEEDRNITMREAARLQGFPDSFVFVGSKVHVAHQIGNAVPPPLAKAVGRAIRRALSEG